MTPEYDFVIDTNLYAGNFERELCGYVTGVWDEETHGGDQAKVFEQEVENDPFRDVVELRSDGEHGWMQPQHLELTPPDFNNNNSVAIHFEEQPTQEQIEMIKYRSYKFATDGLIFDKPVSALGLKILGFRILKRTTTTEIETVQP